MRDDHFRLVSLRDILDWCPLMSPFPSARRPIFMVGYNWKIEMPPPCNSCPHFSASVTQVYWLQTTFPTRGSTTTDCCCDVLPEHVRQQQDSTATRSDWQREWVVPRVVFVVSELKHIVFCSSSIVRRVHNLIWYLFVSHLMPLLLKWYWVQTDKSFFIQACYFWWSDACKACL